MGHEGLSRKDGSHDMGQMRANIKAKAIESESNQERIEAIAENYEGAQPVKAMHDLATLQGWDSNTQGTPKDRCSIRDDGPT